MARVATTEARARVLSSVVLVPAVLIPVWMGGAALAVAIVVLWMAILSEWSEMTGLSGVHVPAFAGVLAGLPALAFGGPAGVAVFAPLGAMLGALAVATSHSARVWGVLGPLAIGPPLAALHVVRELSSGRELLLACVLVVWATDPAAYAGGRRFGGPKLAPRISPSKTWSGFAAGLFAAVMAGMALGEVWGAGAVQGGFGGMALGLAAHAGDLAASAVKRAHGRKDSGTLIPGHGGVLDRFASLLMAVSALALWSLLDGVAR